MAIAIQQISPVAHLPLVLGVVRKLNVAALIDTFCPPHPANVLSCGRGVEALLLAILDGHHALYKVGARLEERGMLPLLQPGLPRTSLHDYRLGQILEAHVQGVLAKDDDFSLRSRAEINVNVVSSTKTSLIILTMTLGRRVQEAMDKRDCWFSNELCSPMPLMLWGLGRNSA